MDTPLSDREPVRLFVLVTSAVAGLAAFFSAWGGGVDWRVAIGMGLAAFALPAGGAEAARARVYSPATANTLIDAEAVIADVRG